MQIRLFYLQDGGFSQIIHSNVYKWKQLQSTFWEKTQLLYAEYLTITKKN